MLFLIEMALTSVTISGSYRKFADEVAWDIEAFQNLGVKVLSPKSATILASLDGFVSLRGDLVQRIDHVSQMDIATAMKLIENSHLRAIQQSDALWLTIPNGYCGAATSTKIGWALAHNVPVFYDGKYRPDAREPIIKMYAYPAKSIEDLVVNFEMMPKADPLAARQFQQMLLPPTAWHVPSEGNATIAVGPVIADYSNKRYHSGQEHDILIVKTYKWGGRWSIVGGKLRKGERVETAFTRITDEQTRLEGAVGEDICVFDEIPDSGYFEQGARRVFVDKVMKVKSRTVQLDDRAEEYVWVPPSVALEDFNLEPNARKTIERYQRLLIDH